MDIGMFAQTSMAEKLAADEARAQQAQEVRRRQEDADAAARVAAAKARNLDCKLAVAEQLLRQEAEVEARTKEFREFAAAQKAKADREELMDKAKARRRRAENLRNRKFLEEQMARDRLRRGIGRMGFMLDTEKAMNASALKALYKGLED